LCVFAVKVPLDAYMMDLVFSEKEDGGVFYNREGMDYHIPVSGGIAKEPSMHIVHIAFEIAPIARVILHLLLTISSWSTYANQLSILSVFFQ
jgi:hypothetical protein